MNTLNEQIIFQMGLNLKKYQEIEQTLKNLISSSGQTISTSIRSDQDKLDMEAKSNYPGVWQGTLGGLWAALEQTQNFSDNPCDTSEHISDLNMTYQIPLTALIEDRQQFEQQFKQIVSDRNAFIHPRRPPRAPHPRQIVSDRNAFDTECFTEERLHSMRQAYRRAECFQKEYLDPLAERLRECLLYQLDQMIKLLNYWETHREIEVCAFFDEVYQKCKRKDGWADWQTVMQEMRGEFLYPLEKLREKSSLGKDVPWHKVAKDIFPKWQFKEETTDKGGKRLLVKINNEIDFL